MHSVSKQVSHVVVIHILFIVSFTFILLLVNGVDLSNPEANNNQRVFGRRKKHTASRGFLATPRLLLYVGLQRFGKVVACFI